MENNKPTFKYAKSIIPKEEIEKAMRVTKSNKAAARFLGVTDVTYKKYAKYYVNDKGVPLLEVHRNKSGKGIKKHWLNRKPTKRSVNDIIEGRVEILSTTPETYKDMLVREGFLQECCQNCGYEQRRKLDTKIPLLLNFKDFDTKNWKLDNLEFLCYNCYFLNVGEVFHIKQLKSMERPTSRSAKRSKIDFDLPLPIKDAINENRFAEAEKETPEIKFIKNPNLPDDFGMDLVSRI